MRIFPKQFSRILLVGISIFFSASLVGQGTISGKLVDNSSNDPIPLANVVLLAPGDSSLVTGESTTMEGDFSISTSLGNYLLKVQVMGYNPYYKNLSLTDEKPQVNLGKVRISPGSQNLDEVEVSAEKRQVEIDGDKTIFNVEKDITTAGGTAEDAFQNLPSVTIDQDGDVSMRGNSNVRIFVNGRQTALTGVDDATLLQQIPASSIEKVEVITNPSARYDAEGSAGIINIVLKRNTKGGFSGMVNLTGGLPHEHNINTNLRYNKNSWRIEGGYNFQYEETDRLSEVFRTTTTQDSVGYLDQERNSFELERDHNFNVGLEYRPSDRDMIFGEVRASISEESGDGRIDYDYLNANRVATESFFRTINESEEDWRIEYSLGYERKYDDADRRLFSEFTYMLNTENTKQVNFQDYEMVSDGDSIPQSNRERQLADEFRQNYVGQIDYVHPFSDDFKGEIGAKSSIRFIRTGNAFSNFYATQGEFLNIDSLRNIFEYDEVVNAGYVSGTYDLDKWSFQGGVRAEHTMLTSDLVSTEKVYEKEYLNLFPSAFISYKPSPKEEARVGITRRIDRPGFWALNPFPTYEDPLNVRQGNPDLDPELTWSSDATYIRRWEGLMLNATLYYRVTDDVIKRYRRVTDGGVAIFTRENLAREYAGGAEIFINQDVAEWWQYNVSANLAHERLEVTELQQAQNTEVISFRARTSQTFILPWDLNLQFNVFYLAPQRTVQGRFEGFNYIDAALKRDFLNDNLSVTLRVSDIFKNRRFQVFSEQSNATIDSEFYRTSRRFFVSLTYKFNKYKEKSRGYGGGNGGDMEGGGF